MGDEVFVHEFALCESQTVGSGTRIWAFAHVMSGSEVGRDCNVCEGVFIESGAAIGDRVTIKNQTLIWDGVTIEDDCFLGPSVVFTNDRHPRSRLREGSEHFEPTRVSRRATIGANATIICGISIGESAFVGAGALVAGDVPAHGLVAGNPAKRIGWACECGHRLDDSLSCPQCDTEYGLEAFEKLHRLTDRRESA